MPIAACIFVVFCLVWNLLSFGNDLIFKANNATNAENFAQEIAMLKDNSQQSGEYIKQYKKRDNYNSPTSSEANDYEDSIIIEKVQKEARDSSIAESAKQDSSESADSSAIDSAKLAKTTIPTIKDSPKITPKPKKDERTILLSQRPKIVIIIDDIANTKQLSEVTKIDLKITPSIFPVSQGNKKMLQAIENLDFFMIHLPLEAKKYHDELYTLTTNMSEENINQVIDNIMQTTPKARYMNNHTGSKFTESKSDMIKLLKVLKSHNVAFVDSRTTPNSVLNDIAAENNELIMYRDIFVDNTLERSSLDRQLREGVRLARERDYAILIGHPHKETFEAIKAAKNSILKDVDVVYLNELESMLKNTNITAYSQKIQAKSNE